MKRTKEEVMLNEWIDKNYGYDRPKHMKVLRLITVLVRAVREDCAKVAVSQVWRGQPHENLLKNMAARDIAVEIRERDWKKIRPQQYCRL